MAGVNGRRKEFPLSTYQKGRYFFWAAASLTILLWIWFFLAPADRMLILVLMILPAAIVAAGALLCRCKICGRSAFRREIYPADSFLGTMINPNALWPEERCSRCNADLWAQTPG